MSSNEDLQGLRGPASWDGLSGNSAELLLSTLQHLLELTAVDLHTAMNQAGQLLTVALKADKVDVFLYDPAKDVLRAMGTSDTPLGLLQVARGLDVLPISNGGTVVRTYQTGESLLNGHVDQIEGEVPGIIHVLGVRSLLSVPLEVDGERRGVLSVHSQTPEFFRADDLRFLQAVACWIGIVAHRAELLEASTAAAHARGRREAAEELILVLAHDLRNHLSPLKIRVELLRMRASKEDRESDVRDAELAHRSIDRLGRMVGNLLDVGRLEQGMFMLQQSSFDLMALMRDTAQVLETADNPIRVSGPPTLGIYADIDRLRQLLENLIGNALKHSPKGKAVLIKLHTEPQHEPPQRLVIVEVADQGPGVLPEVLPHLFERFARAGREQGLGLGLYLAHRIAIAHGGSLSVNSALGQGASFRLQLPILEGESGAMKRVEGAV